VASSVDSGLLSLALVAQLHHVAANALQLQHQFGQNDAPCTTEDILRAAISLGFKAKPAQLSEPDLNPRALPAICQANDGDFFVVARQKETEAS
jgi:subfamily B ATP-binding cassette protein HlyB/CyaB